MNTKICSICKRNKSTDDFYKNRNRPDGLAHECAKCSKMRQSIARQRPGFNAYDNAKKRCLYPSVPAYPHYGGRGITFDKETFATYEIFWETYGHLYQRALEKYPDCTDLQIDRIDNDGNYEPGNIRWVPNIVNQNNRRDNIFIKYKGQEKTLSNWAREFNIPLSIFRVRRNQGWTMRLLEAVSNSDASKDPNLAKAITLAIKEAKNESKS